MAIIKASELWARWYQTEAEFTKPVNKGRRSFTAIDAYYRLDVATRLLGPMGLGFGLRVKSIEEKDRLGILEADLSAVFWYRVRDDETDEVKIVEFEVYNTCPITPVWKDNVTYDSEWKKKVITDTLTKALSYIGCCADVFMGAFDGDRYEERQEALMRIHGGDQAQSTPPEPEAKQEAAPEVWVPSMDFKEAITLDSEKATKVQAFHAVNSIVWGCSGEPNAAAYHMKEKHGAENLKAIELPHIRNLLKKAQQLADLFDVIYSKDAGYWLAFSGSNPERPGFFLGIDTNAFTDYVQGIVDPPTEDPKAQ